MDKPGAGQAYPSPLDRIRTGKRERAAQLGLATTNEYSFDANQSFPKSTLTKHREEPSSPNIKQEHLSGEYIVIYFVPQLQTSNRMTVTLFNDSFLSFNKLQCTFS